MNLKLNLSMLDYSKYFYIRKFISFFISNIISSFDFSPNKKQNEKKNWFESFSQILGGMNKLEKLKMEISL